MPLENTRRHTRFFTCRACRTVLFAAACACISACSAEPGNLPGAAFGMPVNTRDPAILASLITSNLDPDSTRQSADRILAGIQGPWAPLRLAALSQVIGDPAQPQSMRVYALEALAQANPPAAIRVLSATLPEMDGDLLACACSVSVRLSDAALIAPLLESLDRPPGTADGSAAQIRGRPEWTAIAKIAGAAPEKALESLVIPPAGSAPPPRAARIAALDILQNMVPRPALLKSIASATAADPWLNSAQGYARRFQNLPVGPMENRWLEILQEPENAPTMDRAAAAARRLRDQPDFLAAPRFIGVLAASDDAALSLSGARLLADLTTGPLRLNAFAHVRRTPSSPGALDDVDNALAANISRLSRGDLLSLRLLARALANPATLTEFARQGAADLADTATEHGGVLSIAPGAVPAGDSPISLRITSYPPLVALNNAEYVASDELLDAAAAGIAIYHFHFQKIDNAEVAGPGIGDLQFARRLRVNGLVITSIAAHQLDFQYYTPTIAVVDLGVRNIPH